MLLKQIKTCEKACFHTKIVVIQEYIHNAYVLKHKFHT
jgi:hypothetical protein